MNAARIARLEAALSSAGVDAALLTRPEHLTYFAGAPVDPGGALIIGDGPPRISDAVPRLSGVIGVDDRVHAVAHGRRDVCAAIRDLRRVKDGEELDRIDASMTLAVRGLAACRRRSMPGVTDHDLWGSAQAACAPAELHGDIGVSPAVDGPDGPPSGAALAPGEHVFVDLYPMLDGYYGDATRVYCVGRADPERLRVHAALWAALERVAEQLRPGASCSELDAVCRRSLQAAGVSGDYPHHTGHGIGLEQQEAPSLTPQSGDVLVDGDVVAIEPGFYKRGWGGMRIEDSFVVRADGPQLLTDAPRQLEVIV